MINISNIPNQPWIYFFKTKTDKILYIGKAKDLKKRVSQYFMTWSLWKQDMVAKADKVDFLIVNTESEALLLEQSLIKRNLPPYNSLLKWDNSYVYIKITNEDFPLITMTRFRENDGAIYIWPKPMRNELKKLLHIMRQFLWYRTCKKTEFAKNKLCSDYIFGLCKGWCVNKSNLEYKDNYKKIISLIVDFFKWNSKTISNELLRQINDAVDKQNFERAAKLRDIYINLEKFIEKQTVVIDPQISWWFFQIKEVGEYYAYVLLNFFQWRLIDIIRYKEKIQDISISDIIQNFENEFGEFKVSDENFGFSKKIKKLPSEQKNEIKHLMDNFLESMIVSSSFEKENLMWEILKVLKSKYDLNNFPYKIEALDISHFGGSNVSGGLSAMSWGLLYKKWYRNYKIRWLKKWQSDDYKSLKDVITRRFVKFDKIDKDNLPDLFVIDGGKWQLNILKSIYDEDRTFGEIMKIVDFISIGKWASRQRWGKLAGEKEKIFKFNSNFEIIEIDMDYDEADKVLIKIRDEAHRFANRYRKKQQTQEFFWK